MSDVINFTEKLGKFSDLWSPRVIAEMNDYQFKLVKIRGEFVWHDHKDTDEVFVVIEGSMGIEMRDRTIYLTAGEMTVIPKGVEHRPFAREECQILLIEPQGLVNTGEAGGELQAENDVWV
ncbi:cupin domain-containing protein [Halomonas sp. ML-15]|uniref:cupin domain-containing protein n=1 Tax=Halomonas sp. ML-15 TaxID=2773305 RepID=UPI0017473241|nr:cupin domain-containing protein [Halomonas sp. ML-15]MBD3897259.1 cupin domain-containing protein [Halomonas sp. ML-15]